jgi:hypothetical protein
MEQMREKHRVAPPFIKGDITDTKPLNQTSALESENKAP